MKFTLIDNNNVEIFTGTKQECRHYLKCRKLSRHSFTMQAAKTSEPVVHYTVPVAEIQENITPFYKRIFKK